MSEIFQPNHDTAVTRVTPPQDLSPEYIRRVLHDVREAFAGLLHSAGTDPLKIRATARQLELSRGLIWRVSTLITSTDMSVVTQKIPTAESIEMLYRACRKCGASTESIEHTRAVMREFDDTVKRISGDRKSLAMILSSTVNENTTDQQEPARKLAYEANSTIWGTQAQVQLQSYFLAPSGNNGSGTFDCATLSGMVGIRRLRSVSWPLHVTSMRNDEGEVVECVYEPIFKGNTASEGHPTIAEYSSSPLPEIRKIHLDIGTVYELVEGQIGNPGLSTIIFGTIIRGSQSQYRSEHDEVLNFGTNMHTPVERVVMDLFIHCDLEFLLPPYVMLIDRMVHPHSRRISIEAERKRMPISIDPRELGLGPASCLTPQMPWYPKLLRDVYEHLGWPPNDFRGYRLEMTYPPNPTALILGLKKPERPV